MVCSRSNMKFISGKENKVQATLFLYIKYEVVLLFNNCIFT